MARSVRLAQVEYQPNLEKPIEPVPLGVIVEELRDWGRHLEIYGREPRGPIPELQLEQAWGPFKDVVAEWVGTLFKSMREFGDKLEDDEYAIDELARRWRWNVYLKEPETRIVQSSLGLGTYGRRWYAEYVGQPFSSQQGGKVRRPSIATRRRLEPWLTRSNLLETATV
jgi:hypothetical protein